VADGSCQAIVGGHLCLDIIPELFREQAGLRGLATPGSLHFIGPAVLSTGGAVANTGLALHRLGIKTRLLGKVGDDAFGKVVSGLLESVGKGLAGGVVTAAGEPTSYTVVLSPPGSDRVFLHCPGTNDTYGAADVADAGLAGGRIFHFGYPTVMRRMYSDGGEGLHDIFHRARQAKLTTSLDLAQVDRNSDAARVDWRAYFRRVLPEVDVFLPSVDEVRYMLGGDESQAVDGKLLAEIAADLLAMGPAIVAIKLGDQGLYVRTAERGRLSSCGLAGPGDPSAWANRELLAPCFLVNVAGTTGAGDCTIAGFLASLLHGLMPEDSATSAVAAGACCVERPDATSGIPDWNILQARIRAGWRKLPVQLPLVGWRGRPDDAILYAPADSNGGRAT